ncbi:MAG TPA: penicillin-binding transpeptidase domain-containing protein [Kofleriaceae bacterium]|nr:penicillin-binding transpeptidase domain-containing protein [Kofleriaceae bacterium]
MTLASIALVAVRGALILAVVLAALRLLARISAATRRSVLVGAFAIVLALPIATAVLPALHLRGKTVPDRQALVADSAPEPIVETGPSAAESVTVPSAQAAPSVDVPVETASRVSPLALVIALWALGAVAVLARLGVGLVRARRIVRTARFVETLDVNGRPVEVRVSGSIETPAVTGLLVPVILLPDAAETWTAERRRIVLAHELAHIASHDCLASAVAQLAVAMHWFDPLVWLAARRLRLERELAADDRVLDQGVLASSYAEHLLALATTHADRPMPTGALAMADASQVSVRIRALLAPTNTRRPLGRGRFALLSTGLALAAFVACATPDRETAAVPAVETPSPTPSQAPAQAATIDPHIQAIADDEIERMNTEWAPCAAIIVVLDPNTGNILAASYRGGNEPNAQHAAIRPMVAGSTMKPIVIAAALEEGVIKPTDRFDASPSPLTPLADAEPHGMLDVGEILAVSSNVGLAKIFDKLGAAKLAVWQKRFHLASATIANNATGEAVALGKVSTTPLEMAAAFATLANGGIYHAPTFVPGHSDGERVVRAETAATVIALLEGVTGDHGTGKAARVEGVRVAGKTATAHLGAGVDKSDLYSSFVGTAPLENPRYVIFVGAETPRDGGTGGQVAAPVFGRLMARLLAR